MKNGLSLTRDSRRDGLELVGGRWKVELPFPGVCVGVSMEGRWKGGGAWWGQRAAGSGQRPLMCLAKYWLNLICVARH